jgi:hypothetical protein
METKWLEKYNELLKYISDNPEIRIKPTSMSLPGEYKEVFYAKFEEVRNLFVEEVLGDSLKDADVLQEKWNAELSVLFQGFIQEVELDVRLRPFMENPRVALAKKIYKSLLDVIKGNSSLEAFEPFARKAISEEFEYCMDLGYKRWLALKLIDYFDADALYDYPTPDENDTGEMDQVAAQDRFEPLPIWGTTTKLRFPVAFYAGFMVSHVTLHSKRFDRFISIRCDHQYARWTAKERSKNQEWFRYFDIHDTYGLKDLWSDIYIYVANDPKDLTLCGDKEYFCRPHIIIDVETDKDWFSKKQLKSAKRHAIVNQPKTGTLVASKFPVDGELVQLASVPQELDADFMKKHAEIEFVHWDPSEEIVENVPVEGEEAIEEMTVNNDINVLEGTAFVAPQRYSPAAEMDQELNAVASSLNAASPDAVQAVETPVEEVLPQDGVPTENTEEEKPEMEPELDIKVMYVGWDTSALEGVLTDMIAPIPPYPVANW